MTIAKNFWALRKSHTCGGRSRSSQVMRHWWSRRQSSSTGPSRNACSSSDSVAGGTARSFAQSGLPLKRSASHHTSPASIASRSVSESVGSTCCARRKIGLEIKSRRSEVALIEASARVVDWKVLYGCGGGGWVRQMQNILLTRMGTRWVTTGMTTEGAPTWGAYGGRHFWGTDFALRRPTSFSLTGHSE